LPPKKNWKLLNLAAKPLKECPWLKHEYRGGEIWTGGYFVRSVGQGLTKEQIDKYVQEQSEEI